jgi:hypothetical protein
MLTHEVYCTDTRFYLFLVLENSFMRPIYRIVLSFFGVYFKVEKEKDVPKAIQATPEMLNLLWAAKDRSASLHKSLRTLQSMFERMELGEVNEENKEAMISGFLLALDHLKFENLDQLESHFSVFLEKFPANFEQFTKQTKGRSNWTMWATSTPTLSPGNITKSLEKERESIKQLEDFVKKHKPKVSKPESLSDLLGDVSRILANQVDFFEDAVDDLFSVGLYGNWEDMRDQFARMSKNRSDELRNAIEEELSLISKIIEESLTKNIYQDQMFETKAFTSHKAELKQHLSGNHYSFLKELYAKIDALEIPSKNVSLNKQKYEEAEKLIVEMMKMLDEKPFWDEAKALHELECIKFRKHKNGTPKISVDNE